jgi:sugar lactone lactonase YvrE
MIVLVTAGAAVACGGESGRQGASADTTGRGAAEVGGNAPPSAAHTPAPPAPRGSAGFTHVATIQGFRRPESVQYDSTLDVYFVSNINGTPGAKDNTGFISRVRADGTIDSLHFIAGGRNGVTLDSPMGLAILGDTIWVADVDVVRVFNKRTGAHIADVDLKPLGAKLLNDVCIGPDGSVLITDTGIQRDSSGRSTHTTPDQIFRIPKLGISSSQRNNRSANVAAKSDSLLGPNGITWDPIRGYYIVASFLGRHVLSWLPDSTPHVIATGPGQFDGVEVLHDGRVLVTSWADSSLLVLQNGRLTPVITAAPEPAAIGIDTRRHRVAMPLVGRGVVEVFEVPGKG